jgi:hypothetical protein
MADSTIRFLRWSELFYGPRTVHRIVLRRAIMAQLLSKAALRKQNQTFKGMGGVSEKNRS